MCAISLWSAVTVACVNLLIIFDFLIPCISVGYVYYRKRVSKEGGLSNLDLAGKPILGWNHGISAYKSHSWIPPVVRGVLDWFGIIVSKNVVSNS